MNFADEAREILAELEPALRATLNAAEWLRARSLRQEASDLTAAASFIEQQISNLQKRLREDNAIAARIAAEEAVHRGG